MTGLRRGVDSHFAGWYEASGRFVFEWSSRGEFFAWQSATHKELLVTIDGASRKHGKLVARFALPPSNQAVWRWPSRAWARNRDCGWRHRDATRVWEPAAAGGELEERKWWSGR